MDEVTKVPFLREYGYEAIQAFACVSQKTMLCFPTLKSGVSYFFQGNFVPISVIAEKIRYSTSKPIPAKKANKSLSILFIINALSNNNSRSAKFK
ncbi:hypothetical protein [[Phormidium ambiguum] IAM M-71]|uniref:hypothetical protein n=1 Tax=[Phormidium ambiguum] IAM M-71 TaxID=454136 RepID=UPI0015BD0F66|nr:hypothetical protein [Phormidium ambiguum]